MVVNSVFDLFVSFVFFVDKAFSPCDCPGTLSQHGCHLHIAISDRQGRVSGGHLMDGSHIYTTAEVLLGIIPDMIFKRAHDASTGYRELEIEDHRLE